MKSQVKDFIFGNKIPLLLRIVVSFFLVSLAFYLQWLGETGAIGLGFFLMLLFVLFNWVRKVDVKKEFYSRQREWKPTSRAEFIEAYRKIKKTARFVNTSASGIVYVVVIVVLSFILIPLLEEFYRDLSREIIFLAVDLFLIGFVVFSSGNRTIWNPPGLKMKLEWLLFADALVNKNWPGGLVVEPQFYVEEKQDQYVPLDAKLMVNVKGKPPPGLLGLQYSLSLNSVQNKKYPYFYGVVVARREFGLKQKFAGIDGSHTAAALRHSLLMQFKQQKDGIDIIVIRQDTDIAKGYYTPKKAIQQLVALSVNILRSLK
jgi:hypothetical protein